MVRFFFKCLLGISLLLPVSFACATLGETEQSIIHDNINLNNQLTQAASLITEVKLADGCRKYTFTTANGIKVNEYSDGSIVFAISWSGREVLGVRHQLLGDFVQLLPQAKKSGDLLNHVTLTAPNFVMTLGGYHGYYYGKAYIPQKLQQYPHIF